MAEVFRLDDLARRVGGVVRGDPARPIRGIATLADAGPEDLSFLTNPRYREQAARTRAGAVLVGPGRAPCGHDELECAEPYVALALLLELFHPTRAPSPGISPDARLGRGVELGQDVRIEPFAVVGDEVSLGQLVIVGAGAVIGDGCRVGARTHIGAGAVLYPGTLVGAGCRIHAGVVLGADGFGFASARGEHHKLPQVGRVVVEDDVEIGANTTVDRAMLGRTRIGKGTKIDDLVMIAHGVDVGPGSLLVAQSGVAGSTRLGPRTTLAGQAGVGGHLELAEGTTVAAKSAVFADTSAGAVVAGIPAIEHRRWKRAQALWARLPELRRELQSLLERIEALERRLPPGE